MEIKKIKEWKDGKPVNSGDFNNPCKFFKPFAKYSYEQRLIILTLLKEVERLEDICQEFIYNESDH